MTLQVPVVGRGKAGHDFPERKPDGSLDLRQQKLDPADVRAVMLDILQGGQRSQEEIEAEKRATEWKRLSTGVQRGDPSAIQEAIQRSMMELRADDPLFPGGAPAPGDFLAEFPVPLDTSELITLCDETSMYRALNEVVDDRNVVSWRELNELDFISGCDHIAFDKGDCPDGFDHDGENKTQTLKHIGAEKALAVSDILASRFSIFRGYGMRELVGPLGPGEGGYTPGENQSSSMPGRNPIADLREKEMRLASVLVLNGWDDLLVNGDASGNALEFDGLVEQVTAANGARANGGATTGTFGQTHFDQFMAAGCAYPDTLFGHNSALLAISNAYFQAGTQTIFYDSNQRITPGFSFAPEIVTAFGNLRLVADKRFPITDNGNGTITSTVYPLLTRHNGVDLVYKQTQIPLSFKDLPDGCSAVRFMIWAVTALVVKAMCAQSLYTARFSGLLDDANCGLIHPCQS